MQSFKPRTDEICKLCRQKERLGATHRQISGERKREQKELKRISAEIRREAHKKPHSLLASQGEARQVTPEEKEAASRIISRRRLLPFVLRFQANYLPGWVHEDICRRLERFVRDVEAGKSPRLLLCMPPRAGKSTLTSRFFPAWVLGQHPDWEIIAASHTQSLALKFSGFIRDLLRDSSYQQVFPACRLDPESQSKEAWDTTEGGGYLAAGVGTGITGRGAHILIVDDPVKDMEAADSSTIRDNTWEWYTSTAYTRLAPGGGVLGIMTLWNEDDWGGRIIEVSESGEGDKFEIVRYPAINEGYAEWLNPDDEIVKVYPGYEPPKRGLLLREPDSALHEARYNLDMLLKIKKNFYARNNKRVWSALYQQNPTPEEGAFFTKDMFRWHSAYYKQKHHVVYQAWDFAITEKQQNDWTVCTTIAQDENDVLHVIDIKRFKTDDSFVIVDAILENYKEFNADFLGVEDGQIWKSIKALYEKRCQELKVYPNLEILQPLTEKTVRAGPLRGRMQMKKISFSEKAPWREVMERELLSFPAGKHDDIVDSLAWTVRLTLTKGAPRKPQPPKPKSWKDKLKYIGFETGSHMAA